MKEGCKQLIGIHDFRNFCKMDVGNGVISFIRDIRVADIHLSNQCATDSGKKEANKKKKSKKYKVSLILL